MIGINVISLKRQLLSNFRTRFAPEAQQTRETLIDSFIQQVLYISEIGFSVEEIQNNLHTILKVNVVGREIWDSLARLITRERVHKYEETLEGIKLKSKRKILFKLQSVARETIEKQGKESSERFYSVCKRLFRDSEKGWEAYVEPFFKFLTLVFLRLAGENYRMVCGDLSYSELSASVAFSSALNSIKRDLKSSDFHFLADAAEDFFRNPDPEYATIKWNLAQNYYALKVIGLEKQSLSEEVFANAKFYLDTNVVISALEPREAHHKAFISLCEVCEKLGIEIKVCGITLEELDRVIATNREMIVKVIDQIPEEITYKISSDFFEAYVEKKKSGEAVDIDAIFENFESAEEKLKDSFKVEKEDAPWFDQVEGESKTSDFAKVIADRYIKMRKHRKGAPAAKHDAMCLQWIDEERQKDNHNIWFITRDSTLPGCTPPESKFKSLAITLDALIQWLSPMVVSAGGEEDLALAYSEIIRSRILPQERIFNLEDFIIFHELEMECKALPPEDVEGCIRNIKQNIPLLNPTEPADREKLARSIAIYFANPSRKYKENVERYESELIKLRDEIEKQTKISLRKDAWLKVSHIAILFIILEIIVCSIAANLGSGENTFQRIVNSWPFVVVPLPLSIGFGWFYIGKRRIRALGWPMTKIFRNE